MTAAIAMIGHNNPPEPTPYEAIKLHIDDLFETAQGFLDGEPIATQAQADDVGKLLDDARKAQKAADAQRKIEAKPFDDGKAEVQALWTPMSDEKKGRAALIADMAKRALAPFLQAEQARKDAEAAEAHRIAQEVADKARREIEDANAGADLAARERAEETIALADSLAKAAKKLDGARASVAGGARAVSLRVLWTATLTDPLLAIRHYWATNQNDFSEVMTRLANQDARAGVRVIPGFAVAPVDTAV